MPLELGQRYWRRTHGDRGDAFIERRAVNAGHIRQYAAVFANLEQLLQHWAAMDGAAGARTEYFLENPDFGARPVQPHLHHPAVAVPVQPPAPPAPPAPAPAKKKDRRGEGSRCRRVNEPLRAWFEQVQERVPGRAISAVGVVTASVPDTIRTLLANLDSMPEEERE